MKKLISIIFFISLITITGVAVAFNGPEVFSMDTVELSQKQVVNTNGVEDIIVKSKSVDVHIVSTNSDELNVELKGNVSKKLENSFELDVNERSGVVEIELKRDRNTFQVFAINHHTVLEVTIPNHFYNKLDVSTSSGDINMEGIEAKNVTIEASSGDIHTKNSRIKELLTVITSSGDSVLENATAKSVAVKASSGDVIIQQDEVSSLALDFKANSGDGVVNLSNINYHEKSEHRIVGSIGNGENIIKIRTSSGDFRYN